MDSPPPKYNLDDASGLEDIYDLIQNGSDQDELEYAIQALKAIERRYQNQQYVNEGGMKLIQAEFDAYCQRKVARAELKNDNHSCLAFIHEARILARLEHSNIVPLYDLGLDENDQPYFTMRLLSGENLQEILDKLKEGREDYLSTYSNSYLREIFLKVCDAIAYAHTKHIIHLDLKPANIQIDQFGEVLVCDWGLARSTDKKDDFDVLEKEGVLNLNHTMDGKVKGTPGFMAPEQINNKAHRSEKTDIYSLGALLYSILTFETAISSSSIDDLFDKTLNRKFLSPKERCPNKNIPSSLDAVVQKAMATKPENRYGKVQDLIDEVRAYNSGFATQAEDASLATQAGLLIKRYRRLFTLSLIFFLTLTLTVSAFIFLLNSEKNLVEMALDKSKKAETIAKQAQNNALDLVNKLENEKASQNALRKNVAPQLHQLAINQQRLGNFSTAKFICEYALSLDPSLSDLRYMVALTQFGDLDFKTCLQTLGPMPNHADATWLQKNAQAYADMPPNIDELHRFIVTLKSLSANRQRNLKNNLVYSISTKLNLEDRLKFARLFLFFPENNNSFFELEKLDAGYSLSLRNSKTFLYIDSLSNLPLIKLDLSNTNTTDLSPIKDIPLEELYLNSSRVIGIDKLNTTNLKIIDLRNTLITNINFLENSPIEELYLGEQWMSLRVLKTCTKLKKIEITRGRYGPHTLKKHGVLDKVVFREK